ncbi:glycosyltransferase family 2 protein [Paenibacillus sp. FSL L8-0463]|uniref:glycosyltransferase family 2 protein n=1 Tax=Paenibacillus sp. FSL L8-0463 TaxID=2954687 RepID=UPI0031199B9E
MNDILLSIVIPTYNLGNLIKGTLDSLVKQSVKNFEVVIIDDGSTDKTVNFVEEYKSDLNLKIISQENSGVSFARNRGIEEASGEYILFLDGDDYVSEKLVERINSNKDHLADVICWEFNLVDGEHRVLEKYSEKFKKVPEVMTGSAVLNNILVQHSLWICTGSAAYRKDLLLENNILYTLGCANGEDQEFTFKILSLSSKVFFIHEVLFYYVVRKGSLSNSYNINRFDVINAIKRIGHFLEEFGKKSLSQETEVLMGEHIIINYINNLDSCLASINENDRYTRKTIKKLLNSIDTKYPGLNNEVFKIMKNFKGGSVKFKLKLISLRISPFVYTNLLRLSDKLKTLKTE